jgi:hypothetical protein
LTDIHQAKTVRILIASPSDVAADLYAPMPSMPEFSTSFYAMRAAFERLDFHHAITPFSFLPS